MITIDNNHDIDDTFGSANSTIRYNQDNPDNNIFRQANLRKSHKQVYNNDDNSNNNDNNNNNDTDDDDDSD